MLRMLRAALLLLCVFALSVNAQTYPNKPIRLVVPYPPGALTDLLGRAIGERLAAALKQPVVIDNRPGAGTLVGAEAVAKAPAGRGARQGAQPQRAADFQPLTLSFRAQRGICCSIKQEADSSAGACPERSGGGLGMTGQFEMAPKA